MEEKDKDVWTDKQGAAFEKEQNIKKEDGIFMKVYFGMNSTNDGLVVIGDSFKIADWKAWAVAVSLELKDGKLIIPSTAEYDEVTYPVTEINKNAFSHTKLTSVVVPATIKEIGEYAFAGCKSLRSISIPDSVKIIGPSAFYHCIALTSITIPISMKAIGEDAFHGCAALGNVIYGGTIEHWKKIKMKNRYSNPSYYSGELRLNGRCVQVQTERNANKPVRWFCINSGDYHPTELYYLSVDFRYKTEICNKSFYHILYTALFHGSQVALVDELPYRFTYVRKEIEDVGWNYFDESEGYSLEQQGEDPTVTCYYFEVDELSMLEYHILRL